MIAHRGLRHLAIRVTDVERAKEFYARAFGMRVAWQPDPDNVYMSSGCDSLAFHRGEAGDPAAQSLDHFGFVVATVAEVEGAKKWAGEPGSDVPTPLRPPR